MTLCTVWLDKHFLFWFEWKIEVVWEAFSRPRTCLFDKKISHKFVPYRWELYFPWIYSFALPDTLQRKRTRASKVSRFANLIFNTKVIAETMTLDHLAESLTKKTSQLTLAFCTFSVRFVLIKKEIRFQSRLSEGWVARGVHLASERLSDFNQKRLLIKNWI